MVVNTDARLAQRRQHGADVVQELAIRPDHEHTVALHLLALGVEQVCDPVQRDHGLTGAGPALDDEYAGVIEVG